VRVTQYDAAVEAALSAARAQGLWIIVRIQDAIERRLVVENGRVERERTTRVAGLGVHVFTADGSAGFASVDDLRPEAAREAVVRAGTLAKAASALAGGKLDVAAVLAGGGGDTAATQPTFSAFVVFASGEVARRLHDAQLGLTDVLIGAERVVRSTHHTIDEQWRIARSDGTDVAFSTSRALTRHDLSGRVDGRAVRAGATVSGVEPGSTLSEDAIGLLRTRARRSAADAMSAVSAPPPASGSYRLVLNHALAKGLAHEAIGHLCESDVDASVLMRGGRLRVGERFARESVSIVDGPLSGDFVQQPISANGIPRQTVALIDRGVLARGLGDVFSAGRAGVPITGACRASSFRDRPTPRMTNIRVQLADALPLAADPDQLTAEDVAAALRRHGLLDRSVPTLYLAGYRGGQAHPRRGDFVFGAEAAYDLTNGVVARSAASFSGLAERALAAIVAGIGPLLTDAIGSCGKDGSAVSSSGGSHALLVLDPDSDLVVSAAQ
jgi:TldD protein